MDAKERRSLETELMKMGLAGLQENGEPSGALVEQIAAIVNHWEGYQNRQGEWVDRHKFVRDLLNECEADQRSEMYTALAPKLKFKPHSLETYESMIALKAGALISQRRMRVTGDRPKAIDIGGLKVQITSQERANCGWAAVRCHQCDKVGKFVADTPVGAMIKAREAGWVREAGTTREICPECAKAAVN